MVFQHFALLPHRSVLDNAGYALEIAGVPRAERQEKAGGARMVGLDGWEDKLPAATVRRHAPAGRAWPVRWRPAPTSC